MCTSHSEDQEVEIWMKSIATQEKKSTNIKEIQNIIIQEILGTIFMSANLEGLL